MMFTKTILVLSLAAFSLAISVDQPQAKRQGLHPSTPFPTGAFFSSFFFDIHLRASWGTVLPYLEDQPIKPSVLHLSQCALFT